MKNVCLIMALLVLFIFASCSEKDYEEDIQTGVPISFNVVDADSEALSRAMIEGTEMLQNACAYDANAEDKHIAVKGLKAENGGSFTSFINDNHLHFTEQNGWRLFAENDHSLQTYYWMPMSSYRFWFSYPSQLLTFDTEGQTATMSYDTYTSQEDVMLGYCGAELTADNPKIDYPLPVDMKHAMAALRVSFEYGYEDEDLLTGCWFEFDNQTEGFYTAGTLKCAADNMTFEWTGTEPRTAGECYKWSLHNAGDGMPLSMTNVDGKVTKVIAHAYSMKDGYIWDDTKDGGKLFTQSDGWIFLIPQEVSSPQSIKLCFTTWNNGKDIVRVSLPATFGSDAVGGARELRSGHKYEINVKINKNPYAPGLIVEADTWEVIENSMVIN